MSKLTIRALAIDDEPVARRTLRRLITAEPGIECVGEAWGQAAVEAIAKEKPDVVFLDVQMPGMSGFEVLANIDDADLPLVVFVTAFDDYAVRAFEVRAIDYLVKPFTDERFREVLHRVRDRMTQRRSADLRRRLVRIAAEAASASHREAVQHEGAHAGAASPAGSTGGGGERLVIRGSGQALVVRHREIDWLEAVGSYVRVHAGDLKKLVRESLTNLIADLDGASFCRIHRSSVVNLDRVREIESLGHGDALVRLVDGTELRVSRSRREAFERALEA